MTTVQLALSHHWRVPAHVFERPHADDVTDRRHAPGRPTSPTAPAVVLVHGLMGWHAKPRFAVFAEHLTEWFTVYAFDMRGHGGVGRRLATSAAPRSRRRRGRRARSPRRPRAVVTIGTSQGGIAVLRHAGLARRGRTRSSAISSLAYWDWRGGARAERAPAARRAHRYARRPRGAPRVGRAAPRGVGRAGVARGRRRQDRARRPS